MKKIMLLAASVCCVFSIFSCSQEIVPDNLAVPGNGVTAGHYITFNDPFLNVPTKGVISEANYTSLTLYVEIYKDNQLLKKVEVTNHDGSWQYSPLIPWVENSIYSFRAIAKSSYSFSGQSLDGPAYAQSSNVGEMLYAAVGDITAEQGIANGVTLNLKRVYNKVNFTVSNDSEDFQIDVTSAKVYFPDVSRIDWNVSMNPSLASSATWYTNEYFQQISQNFYTFKEVNVKDALRGEGFECYLMPCPSDKSLFLYVDIAYDILQDGAKVGEENKTKVPIEIRGDSGFAEGGKLLNIVITISPDGNLRFIGFDATLTSYTSI